MIFSEAVEITCDVEGPLSYDTDDNLPTKWGIRAAYYPEVLTDSFTREDAIVIYRRDYWDRVSCDKFPAYLRFLLFECAVNQGQVKAIRLLQQALRVKQDGIVGPVTIQAATTAGLDGVDEFTARRIGLYFNTSSFIVNGLGWMRRLVKAYRRAILDDIAAHSSPTNHRA